MPGTSCSLAGDGRPNLLIVQTDQQSTWTLNSYGGRVAETPHANRLSAEGVTLERCMTPHALCTPSRGAFVTGRFPRCNGAWHNHEPLKPDERTFGHQLTDAGYATGYAGKWHLDGRPKPGWVHPDRTMGFTDGALMYNRGHWKRIEEWPGVGQPTCFPTDKVGNEVTYPTDWLTERATGFIDEHLQSDAIRPFAYMIAIPDPHGPFSVRAPYDTMFDPAKMVVPGTFYDDHLPDWASADRYAFDNPNREQELRRDMALYYGMVKHIDDCLGRLLAYLDEKGLAENTVVVFTSDHGEFMGEHGLSEKNRVYETAHHVPMIIRWPRGLPAGRRVKKHTSLLDFQPTILSLLGVEHSGREQGKDASRLLREDDPAWEDVTFLVADLPRRLGVFAGRHQLAYVEGGETVLFDRINDPEQTCNLAKAAEHADTVRQLTRRIRDYFDAFEESPMETDWLPDL